jgi:hypothetical protein
MLARIEIAVAQAGAGNISVKMTYTMDGVVSMKRNRIIKMTDGPVLTEDRAIDLLSSCRNQVDWWARQLTLDF